MESPIQREFHGVVIAVERWDAGNAARIGERARRRQSGRAIVQRQHLIVGRSAHAVRTDVGECKRNRVGIDARQIDLGPAVARVLVDVGRARRQIRRDFLLEMRRRFLTVRVLKIAIHLHEPGPPDRRDQSAELLRAVQDLVVILIVELIAVRRLTDRVFERRDIGAGVEVEPSEESLPHRLPGAREIPRETEPRTKRLEIGHCRFTRGYRLKIRRLLRRETLLGPPELVAIESQAGVDRDAPRDAPAVLDVHAGRHRVIDPLVRRVVDVDFGRRVPPVAIIDVARLEPQEIASFAIHLRADLEIVASGESIDEVRERAGELRLQRSAVMVVVRRAGLLAGVEIDPSDRHPFNRGRFGLSRIEREVVAPVRRLQIEEGAAAQCARPLDFLRSILRVLPVRRRDRAEVRPDG